MFPDLFVITVDINPKLIHEVQCVRCSISSEKGTDIGVSPGGVAVLDEASITIVGPESVDGETVIGAGRRVRVPELGLEQQAPWVFRAASVRRWIRDLARGSATCGAATRDGRDDGQRGDGQGGGNGHELHGDDAVFLLEGETLMRGLRVGLSVGEQREERDDEKKKKGRIYSEREAGMRRGWQRAMKSSSISRLQFSC